MTFITEYFNSSEIRSFIDDDGISWFHGTHVCNVLEYANPRVSIPANVEECDRMKVDLGGLNPVWFINKCGVYDLILACKKPVARPFHRWLSHTLLPQLDEKGYIITRKDEETLNNILAEVKQLKEEKECLEIKLEQVSDAIAREPFKYHILEDRELLNWLKANLEVTNKHFDDFILIDDAWDRFQNEVGHKATQIMIRGKAKFVKEVRYISNKMYWTKQRNDKFYFTGVKWKS